MMRSGQVFIVGMNGSGTTMLLDCLAGHSQLFGFLGETKVLPYYIERQKQYGDLADDRNFSKLWRDLQRAVSGPGWRKGQGMLSMQSLGERPRSVAAIFDCVMATLAAAEGKQIWCEKTPMYVHHMRVLADAFPRAKFVHVIRDGRDCAASFHRRWQFNPVRTVFRWKQAVRAGCTQGAHLGVRYFEVRYERLTTMPEESLRELCRFLDVQFEPEILKPARHRPEMTGSTATAIAPNERRAEQYFGPAALKKIERVAGRQLADCGYVTHYLAGDEDPPMWMLRWWEITDDSRRLKEALRTAAGMRKSRRLSYFSRRVLAALRQKSSLK